MTHDNDDKSVVMKVLSGDIEAYGGIVHKYKNIVFGVVYAMIKNYHTAEDITQDVFVDGFIKLRALGEPYNVGAWLVRISKNKCYNYLTRSAIRFEGELYDYIPDTKISTPESFVIEQYEKHALRQAIDLLAPTQKTVTDLFYFDNYSHKQIAQLLQIPIGTVKSRLYDARLKLKKELDKMNGTIQNINFEKEVAKRIKTLEDYYHLNNFSIEGREKEVKKFIELIDSMPESKLKHSAYAAALVFSDEKESRTRAEEEAKLGENAQVYADVFWHKHANHDNHEHWLRSIDGENGIAKIEKMQNSDNAVGEMLFWRGACNIRLKKYAEAREDFLKAVQKLNRDNSYHANAVAALNAVEFIMNESEKYLLGSFHVTGECYRLYDDGKQLDFVNQPGFSIESLFPGKNNFCSIFYYSSCVKTCRKFFDLNMKEGEMVGEDTLISTNETLTVLAGTFDNCIHIKSVTDNFIGETWYAKDIGLIKLCAKRPGTEPEIYELCEYKIAGGTGYMPACEGNVWQYKNIDLSDYYQQFIESKIVSVFDDAATKSKYIYMAQTSVLRASNDEYEQDSDTHIAFAKQALPKQKPKEWDFDTSIKNLKLANQKNSSLKSSLFAAKAVGFIERCAEYYKKDYHFLPSGVSGSKIIKNNQNDVIEYIEAAEYSMGPYVIWGAWYGARRCMGLKPFRFLDILAGTLYSGKWTVGYKETIKNDDGEVYLKVEDGGTVTTKAGAFDNCIKVTFDLEWEGGKNDPKYYLHNTNYSHCGTKIYWYAPNVGIVRHDCIWGKALSSSIELTEYKSCATNGEYMPIYVGNRWIYDEVTIGSEFVARRICDIVSGLGDEFFMIDAQELVFMGTDEEYEKLKQSREK